MGGGTSQPVHKGKKASYAAELKPEAERIAAKAPSTPQRDGKAARESKRLAKMALGLPDQQYKKNVTFNNSSNFAEAWDDSNRAVKPTIPISKGSIEGPRG